MKRPLACMLCMILMCLCACTDTHSQEQDLPDEQMPSMHIAFLGDEAEDAILLYSDAFSVLIDTGLSKTGKEIVEFAKEKSISALDMLIITHFDKDHVGGADKLLEKMPVKRILTADYVVDTKQYRQFIEAAERQSIPIEQVGQNMQVEIGNLRISIDVPDALYAQENDRSLVCTVEYGDCAMLFAGDSENDRLEELLSQGLANCVLLKVPHHGRWEDRTREFISAVEPKIAVITSSEEEPEDGSVIAALESAGAEVFLTRLGLVEGLCDGQSVQLRQTEY